MKKIEGVYVHDSGTMVFVKKDDRRCNLCNDEMWIFRDDEGRLWRFCMGSPAECGLIFPHQSNSAVWGNVVAALHSLRCRADLDKKYHLYVPQLIEHMRQYATASV